MPDCRALWQWAVVFDSIKLRSCAKLWPRRGRERNAAGIGGSTEQGEWEREVHLSWQGFQFLFTFLLLGPKHEEPILNRLPRYGRGNGKDFNVDLRQPFSSLLSKQSGNPSHCHPPGTHLPSAHMKFPGMLHSVVTLLPGSSWLSGGEEGSRWLPTIFLDRYHICNVTIFNAFQTGECQLNAETEVCLQRHLKLAPSAETLNTETPNPRLWSFGLTQQLPAGAEWAGKWNATFLAEVWHVSVRASPKPYWVAERNVAGLGNLVPTWTASRGVEGEAECHFEVRISSMDVRCSQHLWTAASWRCNKLCILHEARTQRRNQKQD